MPELPEVETVARQLKSVLVGKKIAEIEVKKAKSWSGNSDLILQQHITHISRRAKIIRIQFENHQNILIHLKMSGQLIYVDGQKRIGGGHPSPDWIHALPSSHTRVIFTFDDGTKLFFNDQRIFGWLRMVTDVEVPQFFQDVAPDVIDPNITAEYLYEKTSKRKIPIKQFIMDSTIVAGVGNIYACDALNLAKISPLRSASSLSKAEVAKLLTSVKAVINLGIQLGGATADGKYVHVTGLAGRYQEKMRVYDKKGQPCPNCGAKIEKIRLGGRGTYYCPNCQS